MVKQIISGLIFIITIITLSFIAYNNSPFMHGDKIAQKTLEIPIEIGFTSEKKWVAKSSLSDEEPETFLKLDTLMGINDSHREETILIFGISHDDQTIEFLKNARAKQIICIDFDEEDLQKTSQKIALQPVINPKYVRLIKIENHLPKIPIEDQSVDFIYSLEGLSQTVNPMGILKEFHRLLKKDGKAKLMVNNRDSLWFHLNLAYMQALSHKYRGFDTDQVFRSETGTLKQCLFQCFREDEFKAYAKASGFECDYLGGYFNQKEIDQFNEYKNPAHLPWPLSKEHKEFIQSIELDDNGFPIYQGKYAGVGGVYSLSKVGK